MTAPAIGPSRAVEVLHDRGPAAPAGGPRWTSGSGYLIGSRLVLTAAHNVDYRRDLGADEQLLVRMIEGSEQAARVVLVGEELSRADLAVLEITDVRFGEHLPPVTFAGVDRDSPVPVTGCWAVGFPRFGEAEPVLPEGSRRETWHVRGDILPGAKLRAGLLSLQVTTNPSASLTGSAWEGMSGAVVFAADAHDDDQAAVGVISTHHRPEGESALTVVPVTAVAELAAAARWWQRFGVPGPDVLPILPRQRAQAGLARPTSAAGRPLEEVTDPFALEVHRPVQPEDAPPGLPVLPPYVPREHDRVLGQVVGAAAGGRSGIAVLVGGSSTGKTRACWEALALLRDQDPLWRLWHPIDPSPPDAALEELPGIGPRTVVWLNEAQFYLDPGEAGLGEKVAAGLRELLRDPARGPVLVLATLWPEYWHTLTAGPADGKDRHAQARQLLAGHHITVPAAFTAAQMGQLARAADARMVLAARSAPDGAVIQFLAGAPELLDRYCNAPLPAARALIEAAMDARRLGMGAGLPQAFLEAAAPGYLTDAQWDALGEDWPEQALAYTAENAKGVLGPLTRIRPRPARHAARGHGDQPASMAAAAGPLYRLADYLDQHGRAHRASQIPPPEFWSAAAAHAAPGDQAALGDAADARGLYRDAAQLHKNAAAAGDPRAALYLSHPPACLRADPRPAHWAAAHAALDDPVGVARLLDSLREAGAHEQAAALLARDPAAHAALDDPCGVARLLDSLREAGADEQAAALLARDPAAHAPLDDPGGVAACWAACGRRARTSRPPRCWPATRPPTPPSTTRAAWPACWTACGRRARTSRPPRCWPATRPPTPPSTTRTAWPACWTACGRRARTSRPPRWPAGPPPTPPSTTRAAWPACWTACGRRARTSRPPRCWPATRPPTPPSTTRAPWPACWTACGRRARTSRPPRCWPATRPPTPPSTTRTPWPACWTACGRRARTSRSPRWPPGPPPTPPSTTRRAVAILLDSLRQAGAHEQAAALLASGPAAHAALDDPDCVASLLDSLRRAGAHEQAAALAARLPAAGMFALDFRSSSSKAPRISSVSDGRPTAPRPRHGAGKTWTYGLFPAAGRPHRRSAEQGAQLARNGRLNPNNPPPSDRVNLANPQLLIIGPGSHRPERTPVVLSCPFRA